MLLYGRAIDAEDKPIGGVKITGQIPRGSQGGGYSDSMIDLASGEARSQHELMQGTRKGRLS